MVYVGAESSRDIDLEEIEKHVDLNKSWDLDHEIFGRPEVNTATEIEDDDSFNFWEDSTNREPNKGTNELNIKTLNRPAKEHDRSVKIH